MRLRDCHKATPADAYQLFHAGTLALAKVEHAGIKVDTKYLDKAIAKVTRQIADLDNQLAKDDVWKTWQKVYGDKANLTSRPQLADVLFNHMGYPCTLWTAGGTKGDKKPSTEEEHLKTVDLPFIGKYLERAKLEKVRGTYLLGIKRELASDGRIHPVFSLAAGGGSDDERGGARSTRSSSSLPNFQNMPIRSKVQGKLIRRCFIPSDGNVLLEVDYGAIEVRIASAYTKDPTLINYINDPSTDMHRDMAAECYCLDLETWQKDQFKNCRYAAKNMFVFPEFYGSAYFKCAPNLWEAITKFDMRTPQGLTFYEHLKGQGIKSLGACDPKQTPRAGTFEAHIKDVERRFWQDRFPVYAAWKDKWCRDYRRRGWFDLLTGFRIRGYFSRNQILNTPIQGVAFHCLLWSLIRVQRLLEKGGYKAKIVGQIHDSLLLDCPEKEVPILLPLIKEIMTEKIRKAWPWICVPLAIEAEACGVGESWHDKKPIAI